MPSPFRWALLVSLTSLACQRSEDLPIVAANDNRTPAGVMRGDTLVLEVEVREARWFPQADRGPSIDAPAFAEVGKPPQIPGPLIRVRSGTTLAVSIRNALKDSTLVLRGFATKPTSATDSLVLRPGEVRRLRFVAGEPGTYLYTGIAGSVDWPQREREQLAGAFVVDSVAGSDDRVFVINIWSEPVDSVTGRNALAINGKSWPYTERIKTTVGDSLRWRWVNASIRPHPMHLHGFYYRVDAHGDGLRDTVYSEVERRLAVTEVLQPAHTISTIWSPDRDGQWLFHCHLSFHVIPEAGLDPADQDHHQAALSEDAGDHMAGLVLGVQVAAPRGWSPPPRGPARQVRLHVQEGARRARAPRSMSYVLQEGSVPPRPDSVQGASSVLVMHRGEPADITVLNHLKEPTAVHWHGIELESYSDGVAGWSGNAQRRAPLIAPNDSFVARLTLKRAGTFMYHTHLGDFVQLTSGLYGGLLVLEPGERYDPATDHLFVAGWDGPEDPPHLIVNGDSLGGNSDYAFGRAHRLRFINVGMAVPIGVRLTRDTSLVTWRAIAKDGADLPPAQRSMRPAELLLNVGETADFEFRPPARGNYLLSIETAGKQRPYQQRIRVR